MNLEIMTYKAEVADQNSWTQQLMPVAYTLLLRMPMTRTAPLPPSVRPSGVEASCRFDAVADPEMQWLQRMLVAAAALACRYWQYLRDQISLADLAD